MGSQTLEILRQGVWASLTGGWFYDPHQGVFCNVVHLYLWLLLLCSPFILYLYFPANWLTWSLYCIFISSTILLLKLCNMALHRLYDRAQSMSEANLKNQFFKVTKEIETLEDEIGIEMKVLTNDGSRDSVEPNEGSEENSMMSIENVNSIIDLKVDVHRKNSSESLNLIFYAPSLVSGNSQQDQQSLAGSTSVTKSIRSSSGAAVAAALSSTTGCGTGESLTKYLTVYPEHENEIPKANLNASGGIEIGSASVFTSSTSSPAANNARQWHLMRKSSDDFKRRHHSRRLERQSSLHACAEHALNVPRLMRNQSDTITTLPAGGSNTSGLNSTIAPRNDTFLHQQQHRCSMPASSSGSSGPFSKRASKACSIGVAVNNSSITNNASNPSSFPTTNAIQRLSAIDGAIETCATSTTNSSVGSGGRNTRLQRHRSSETHDERLKQQNRGLFLPIHQEQYHHHLSGDTLSSHNNNDLVHAADMELGLGVGTSRGRPLQPWILGSSSDVYMEDDNCTKSDFGIEQLDGRSSGNRSIFLMQQHQPLGVHYHQHGLEEEESSYHSPHGSHHHRGASIRKDSDSTMSALQLAVVAGQPSAKSGSSTKRRRHSNATALFKSGGGSGSGGVSTTMSAIGGSGGVANGQQTSVRRIKSAALEIGCPHPSVSNLTPHPNSVEAITGQQQIKNPPSAVLPPPSKCLVRNPHLNLCPKFGGSFGGSCSSGSSINFGSDSTTALIDSAYPKIVESAEEKDILERRAREELALEETLRIDIAGGHPMDDENGRRIREIFNPNESDSGDMMCDDDEFKYFDDDLDHLINDLEQCLGKYTKEEEENDAKAKERNAVAEGCENNINKNVIGKDNKKLLKTAVPSPTEDDLDAEDDECEASNSPELRHRSHSTDSETDNNGSRSPLLSDKKTSATKNQQKTLSLEMAAMQKQRLLSAAGGNVPSQLFELRTRNLKVEVDSGCPSSDYEQTSASSKDMLLGPRDTSTEVIKHMDPMKATRDANLAKLNDIEEGDADVCRRLSELPSTSVAVSALVNGKNLGAIPKVVKYREIDETQPIPMETCADASLNSNTGNMQLHRRRRGNRSLMMMNSSDTGAAGTAPNNTSSRTSSSTNSLSPSTDSFAADMSDIHKMLWLMHGGPVDEYGRPITGFGADGLPITANYNVLPPNMSSAHFQFYQDALQALNAYQTASADRLSLSERGGPSYFPEKQRRSSKQISEPGNSSLGGEYSHPHDLQSTAQLSNTSQGACGNSHSAIGVVFAPSSLDARNVNNAATLSIQGLINVINDERNAQGERSGHPPLRSAAADILNVDHNMSTNYCEYWRPACLLSTEKPIAPKSFYKYRFKICGFEQELKISMDRLELLALFDRDLHWMHILLSVILCGLVAYLGSTILQIGYYKDLFAFQFCLVIAGSQYSLVKSVQPDAASPIHGFNKTVAYSRAIYFSLCAGLLLVLEKLRQEYKDKSPVYLIFFGMRFAVNELTEEMLYLMYIVLLCFPLIFSLGLLPQVNTFLLYLLEQIDMHVFGGNAASSLLGSFLCVLRSFVGVLVLYGPLYGALAEGKGTQYILFSIFCAMLIPLGYHLSRSASDFSHIWALIKNCIVSTYRDDDDGLSASSGSSRKLTTTTSSPKRLSSKYGATKSENTAVPKSSTIDDSNEHIEMSSLDKLSPQVQRIIDERTNVESKLGKSRGPSLNGSTQTLAKTLSASKKVIAASDSFASIGDGASQIRMESGKDQINPSMVVENVDMCDAVTISIDQLQTSGHKRMDITRTNTVEEENEEDDNDNDNDNNNNNDNENDNDNDKVSESSATNPGDISTITAGVPTNAATESGETTDSHDPLPKKLQNTVNTRLKNDFVVTNLLAIAVLGLHSSTVFTVLQPDLNLILYGVIGALGLLLHYIIPQMRKHMPWLCFARPILKQNEFGQFEVSHAPKVMWFEMVYIYLGMIERNVLYPLLVISALTADTPIIVNKFGLAWGTLIVSVCALKFVRNSYSDATNQYLIVMFTVLLFRIDFAVASETFLIDYFFVSLGFRKFCDFILKLQFIVTYIAPWQITWGSAFHAFAQPFSVPHSAMLFLQAAISAILSTPLNPFLGSAIFLTSYMRPIKFWERDYNTRRIDHSNTRLSSQLERDLGADDNNLNSIFYEHLTRSLQHSLCGDLLMGRWGNVNQGDCFVLASDYLNCLVHIIELGNGLCTFQMRGLEFRGTYCQQREVEAITEDVEDNDGCCCCDPGHLPRMLSANAMFSTRWLAWQVVAAQYVLEGYSITDNLANATLQVFEYRKVLITYYIKSIIYYVIKNPKLEKWLASAPIQDALHHTLSRQFIDLDPIFNQNFDEDFDFRMQGITRSSFCYVYMNWINFCYAKRREADEAAAAAEAQSATMPTVNITGTTNIHSTVTTTTTSSTTANTYTTPATVTTTTTTNNAYNDSKSTPNLCSTGASHVKSQSQQQLRSRPQKSATMSGSTSVNNHSTEQMATSHSFANISRQTSESAPGLMLPYNYAALNQHQSLNSNLGGSSVNAQRLVRSLRATSHRPMKKEGSPTTALTADALTGPQLARMTGMAGMTSIRIDMHKPPYVKLRVPSVPKESPIVSLCLALGLLARRSLATASHSSLTGMEFFLHGLHALFKGDFRITSPRDEWVFADMELLHSVVAPAVKMALKLQQDHITNADEFLDPHALYEAIDNCLKDLVISHEADPVWRSAVLRGAPNLLALRHVMEDGTDEYRIIRLTKRFLSFRVIKLNRECVRGLWAGQQQELIYLRNRNPERGSIQNAKQALRNIINSSCDQPIGYPIYVSPLTTSYADTHGQLGDLIGGAITLESIKTNVFNWWQRIRERCRQGCSSGSATENVGSLGGTIIGGGCNVNGESGDIAPVYISAPLYNTLTVGNFFGFTPGNVSSLGVNYSGQYNHDGLAALRSGLAMIPPAKPEHNRCTLLAGLLNREREEREREALHGEIRQMRKCQTQASVTRADRERRATVPTASTSMGGVSGAAGSASGREGTCDEEDMEEEAMEAFENAIGVTNELPTSTSSPRYGRFTSSSANLGLSGIITTPGDYPRKTKGPISLTTSTIPSSNDSSKTTETTTFRKPILEMYKKVIIVDDTEIYDCLDLGRRIDVVWPSEAMRNRGGRLSWKDWVPRAGMVGYIMHHWIPNHPNQRFRSHVNRVVYLVKIGEYYVPVGEYGLREYNQIVGSEEALKSSEDMMPPLPGCPIPSNQTMQYSLDELQHECEHEGLTPILRSKIDWSIPQLASFFGPSTSETRQTNSSNTLKIKAVSSSSSEDEIGMVNLEEQRRELLFNVWKILASEKHAGNMQQQSISEKKGEREAGNENEMRLVPVEYDEPIIMQIIDQDEIADCEKVEIVEIEEGHSVDEMEHVEELADGHTEDTDEVEASMATEDTEVLGDDVNELTHGISEPIELIDITVAEVIDNVSEQLPARGIEISTAVPSSSSSVVEIEVASSPLQSPKMHLPAIEIITDSAEPENELLVVSVNASDTDEANHVVEKASENTEV